MTRIVFIGDVHIGSNYAILPEDYKNPEDGSVFVPNKWQKKLYNEWCKLAEKLSPVDIIVLMGDLVDGSQRRENWGTLKIQNIMTQADCFIKMFINTWKWNELYVVRGTDYHVTAQGVHIDEYIASQLRATKPGGGVDVEKFSADDIQLIVGRRTFHIAHHVPYSSVPHYRLTPMARQLWLLKLYDEYFGKVDFVIRAHVHYHIFGGFGDMILGLTTPAWQLPTPWQRKKDPASPNDIGLIEFEIFPDNDYRWRSYLVKGFRPTITEAKINVAPA
jgi:hypothetical protein